MVTYAVGDIQGCWSTLQRLLARLALDPSVDRLWLVGDLVNRGHDSLDVLRWASQQDERLTCVLGNHDLHLLACAAGAREPRETDTFTDVLDAPDCDELIAWLRARPLLHRQGRHVLVHAGIPPDWSVDEAAERAHLLHDALVGPHWAEVLDTISRRAPDRWTPELSPNERLAVTAAALTRLRCCTADGAMALGFKGAPDDAPDGCRPWFEMPGRAGADHAIVFGHWAALGLHQAEGVVAIDSGCVWGGPLTAFGLETGAIVQVDNAEE